MNPSLIDPRTKDEREIEELIRSTMEAALSPENFYREIFKLP